MNHLDDDHKHVTETFGTFVVAPSIVSVVLRVSRPRDWTDAAVHERMAALSRNWAERWSTRHGCIAGSLVSGFVGKPPVPPDSFAICFVAIPVPAPDWDCFSQMLADAMQPPLPSFPMMRIVGSPFPTEPAKSPRVN